MTRFRSWIGWSALLFAALFVVVHQPRPGYDDALATFHVRRSHLATESHAVADTLLRRAPVGSTPNQVTQLLEALGYVRSADSSERRPAFHVDSSAARVINARYPYRDRYLSLERFACDGPALRLTFYFDEQWRLRSIEATTARQCVFDGL